MIMLPEVVLKVECAINCLKNKFLESPYFFYTESDMHCYLYHLLYQESLLREPVNVAVGKEAHVAQTIRLHKEYPTLGKFYKNAKILIPNENKYVTIEGKQLQPSRGAYDIAILNPSEKRDFKYQKTSIAIELALNELHPSLWHVQNDYTKITYDMDKVERGYILFFVRKTDLSEHVIRKRLPHIRSELRRVYAEKLQSNVRILYLEAPKTEQDSEIHLPPEWQFEGRSSTFRTI